MNQFLKSIIVLLAFCSGSAVFAEICSTQSKGIYFVSFISGVDQSTSDVLNQCRSSSVTNNQECSTNLACGWNARNPYHSGSGACFTRSHNISFQVIGAPQSISSLTNAVVEHCRQASVTNNQECSQNIACNDASQGLPYPSNKVLCMTNSHSIPFRQVGDASQIASVSNAVVTT